MSSPFNHLPTFCNEHFRFGFGKTRLKSPFLWFSQPIYGSPKPWKTIKIDGLLVNAYEILQKKTALKHILEQKIHRYLQFNGPILMDSGGFLFMRDRAMDVSPLTILDLYEKSKPNFCAVLDHPLDVDLTSRESKRRQLQTLRNTRLMLANRTTRNPVLMPVIHGHSASTVRWFLKRLDKLDHFEIYGLGSLVPSVFNAKGVGGISNVVRLLSIVREHLPDRMIHVFGVGSTLTMHLMYFAGADSVDSSAWRIKAAYGAIQLPGIGDRYITGRAGRKTNKKYLNLSNAEKGSLLECGCDSCQLHSLDEMRKSFKLRAIHNAWVFQQEVQKARELKRKGIYDEYVESILCGTRFSKAFDIAKEEIQRAPS